MSALTEGALSRPRFVAFPSFRGGPFGRRLRDRALYATYSEINARAPKERESVLNALQGIAERTFGGRVERNMLTTVWTARRV